MGFRVEGEGSGGAKVWTVLAGPHVGVGNEDIRIGVAYGGNRECSGGCSEVELVGGCAEKKVAVVEAAAAVVYAEGVMD